MWYHNKIQNPIYRACLTTTNRSDEKKTLFTELSSETWFSHASIAWNFVVLETGFLIILFRKPQQRYFDWNCKNNFFGEICFIYSFPKPSPNFFSCTLHLVSYIVKLLLQFSGIYFIKFKLNFLMHSCCYWILGLVTNQ